MKMNKHEVFSRVYDHLMTQRAKSISSGVCQYRKKNGMSCAIGSLIDNKHYNRIIVFHSHDKNVENT